MNTITNLEFTEGYLMVAKFGNGVEKKIDFTNFLNVEVFAPLKNHNVFIKGKNKGYFVEWEGLDIDISADTLWHEGIIS